MMRWVGWVLLVALYGCNRSPANRDGDGVADEQDCDAGDPSVWKWVDVYTDFDGDGYGEGPPSKRCVGATPPTDVALEGGDCAPLDRSRWMSLKDLGYYADQDGDGVPGSTPSSACVGKDLSAFSRVPGSDCDDANRAVWVMVPLYGDGDGDGVPGGGTPEPFCVGSFVPPGRSEKNLDCAPEDASRYQELLYLARDGDRDGYFIPETGTLCTSETLPPGYAPAHDVARSDCDDTRADRWSLYRQYPDTDGDGVGSGAGAYVCSNGSLEPGQAWTASDCASDDPRRWRQQTYYARDVDGDGVTVPEVGQLCVGATLPAGYSSEPGTRTDCDDTRADAWDFWNLFLDEDGDGVGSGASRRVCAGDTPPAGHAPTGTDCAPGDASRWRAVTYPYRDGDGDGYTVSSGEALCLGASTPPGYVETSRGADCDDTRADVYLSLQGHVDTDGDGVGAGSAESLCTAGALPPGYSAQGNDCAPSDPARWRSHALKYVDADGDGATTPTTGELCAGATLPPPYAPTASGNDCDDTDPAVSVWRVFYPDQDGDGVGAPPRTVTCFTASGVPPGYSIYGFDLDDSNPVVKSDAGEDELELLLSTP